MSDPKSPGVYIQELSSGVKPIAGVGTSTGAFVGLVEKCYEEDKNKAMFIPNWARFVDRFGSFFANGYLAYCVYGFFAEGGTSCYVVPVVPSDAARASLASPIQDTSTPAADALGVTAVPLGTWGNNLTVIIEDASSNKDAAGNIVDPKLFKLSVKHKDTIIETFDRISLLDVAAKVNGVSTAITVNVITTLPTNSTGFETRPANGFYTLAGGSNGEGTLDYIGDESNKRGLHAFDIIDNINIVAIPDQAGVASTVRDGMLYCKNRKDCFFIADPPYGYTGDVVQQILDFRQPYNNSYAALYYPWVIINDPLTNKPKAVPPSGVVAGTYAYTDATRGVHKAPAGIGEGYLDSVSGLEVTLTSVQQERLNPAGVNVIRSLPEGICIWGARTLSNDPEWNYINVRRLLTYIEKSVESGTQWVVFEPNTPELWGNVKRNLTAFLNRVWRDGALFGTTPDEAFFVKVDEENNPPDVRDLGQLIIEVGVAPVKPAEFVIIKIMQKTLS